MVLCSVCKKNAAVLFITKIMNGEHSQEGICLACAMKIGVQPINQVLEQSGMNQDDIQRITEQVGEIFEGGNLHITPSNFSAQENKHFEDKKDKNTKVKAQAKKNNRRKKYLDMYGTNLTELAKQGNIDMIVGREKELDRVVQILNRRTKNNPALLGEPGVGKTAIVQGLALKIANKDVAAKLMNKEVYLLDMTSIVAGTQFRGQFEARMKGIIDEAKALGNIILVIDEVHNIMGAGEAEGAMNAANILKPALTRGEIQIVGATTLDEYRKHIEKDSALERRFQPVIIDEPSIEDTVKIIEGIKGYYETYHSIRVTGEVARAAVELSARYVTDRFLPDKAIDVIDEACSRANLRNTILAELQILKEKLKQVQEEKESAISADSIEDYQKAADLKTSECQLIKKIKELEDKSKDIYISVTDIAEVIESWTKIPVRKLTEEESQKLLKLEERIHNRLIGQEKAVRALSKAIRRNRVGLGKRRKPASFIFVGPTGVGKTELAKVLADEIFGSENALIKMDMSEYMEKHSVSKLIGAPPGYVGYDDAGQLTEKVRRRPYSVILLDEIEKAHYDVFNILLQILDEGRLTDSKGKVVNFENTIIIMTSNAGTSFKSDGIGFNNKTYEALEDNVKSALKDIFRPEFLNRVDEIIVFSNLEQNQLLEIINLMLEEVSGQLQDKGMEMKVSPQAKQLILEKGYDIKYGARPLRRTIQKYVEDEIAELILLGKYNDGDKIVIDVKDGKFQFM